jgi:hypothetical protein
MDGTGRSKSSEAMQVIQDVDHGREQRDEYVSVIHRILYNSIN